MPNLIQFPEELRGRVAVTTMVTVFNDPWRAPYVLLLSRREDYAEHARSACFAVGYGAQDAQVLTDMLGRLSKVSLVHEDGSLYCTLYLRDMEVIR